MPAWIERSAQEWITKAATGGPPGASVAAYVAALGASHALRACERALLAAHGSSPVLTTCRDELVPLGEGLSSLVDRVETSMRNVATARPDESHTAHRVAAGVLLEACDTCSAVLDVAERGVASVRGEDVGDLWIGADLAAASIEALAICVRQSMALAKDETFTRPEKNRLVALLHEARRSRERIFQAVESRMVL